MSGVPTIFILEDNASFALFLKETLKDMGELYFEGTIHDAKKRISSESFDLYLLDMKLPDGMSFEILDELRMQNREGRAVILTAFGDIPMAIEAVRKGALDFWQKPIDYEVLRERVKEIISEKDYSGIEKIIIGDSNAIKGIREDIKRLSGTDINVMVNGPTGAGKELTAKTIHMYSMRKRGNFVHIDFNSIPPDLLESELFGAVKGAYTGSYENRDGRVKSSDKGTLYLDNIDCADMRTQAKLMRFVQDKSYFPIGSNKEVKVDARIISSASEDLKKLIENQRLREDLLYRLNVFVITIPGINERREDIEPIARHYIEKLSADLRKAPDIFTDAVIKAMGGIDWAGNEREIVNFIERSLVTGKAELNEINNFDSDISLKSKIKNVRQEYEKKEISNAMKICGNNKAETAKLLKISYRNLIEKIKEYKIEE